MFVKIYSGLSKLSSANLATMTDSSVSNTGRTKHGFDIYTI